MVRNTVILALGGLVVAGTVAFGWALAARGPDPELGLEIGQERTLRGVVSENTNDPCRFPDDHREPCLEGGPAWLRVDVEGAEVNVYYYEGDVGEPGCINVEALRQGEDTGVGTTVEVFAEVVEVANHRAGGLLTCSSNDYYIKPLD